jgi:hypothetical protein
MHTHTNFDPITPTKIIASRFGASAKRGQTLAANTTGTNRVAA